MNQKNIIILFFFCFIINVYGTLINEKEEELDFSSENNYNQMVMTATSTAAVKTITTQFITTKATSSLKVLPTGTLSMKETNVVFHHNNTFLNLATSLPDNVDRVYATCLDYNYKDYENENEKLNLPYVCYNDDCYQVYDTRFNYTYFKPFGPTTTIDCRLYTSIKSKPSPTASINVLTKPFCIPTYSTQIKVAEVFKSSTEIYDESNTDHFTRIKTRVFSTYTYTSYYSTTCHYDKQISSSTSSIQNPMTVVKTYGDDFVSFDVKTTKSIEPRRVYTVTIPDSIKDYAYTCTKYVGGTKHNGPPTSPTTYFPKTTTKSVKTINEFTTTRYPKTTPAITTRYVKNLPANNNAMITTITTVESIPSPTQSNKVFRRDIGDISFYCEDESFCLERYSGVSLSQSLDVQRTSYVKCVIYTPFEKPTKTDNISIVTTSFCRPVTSIKETISPLTYKSVFTTITSGLNQTTIETDYITNSYYYSTLTECNTLRPTDTMMTITTTTTTPITTTPTSIPTFSSTKCIPEVITIRKKEIVTITEKETVTVTVKKGNEPTSQVQEICASKWEQCGGVNFKGSTCCQSGYTCQYVSPYFSHCI